MSSYDDSLPEYQDGSVPPRLVTQGGLGSLQRVAAGLRVAAYRRRQGTYVVFRDGLYLRDSVIDNAAQTVSALRDLWHDKHDGEPTAGDLLHMLEGMRS